MKIVIRLTRSEQDLICRYGSLEALLAFGVDLPDDYKLELLVRGTEESKYYETDLNQSNPLGNSVAELEGMRRADAIVISSVQVQGEQLYEENEDRDEIVDGAEADNENVRVKHLRTIYGISAFLEED
jgi:hypothetical protein